MNAKNVLLIMVLSSASAFGQTPGVGDTRPTVPGARDGSAPADGAIKGGSILPGERSGVPGKAKCEELTGSLREECLKHEREAGVGGTTTESGARETPPSAPVTTPPQNPSPVVR